MLRWTGVWTGFRLGTGRGNVQNLNGVVTPHNLGAASHSFVGRRLQFVIPTSNLFRVDDTHAQWRASAYGDVAQTTESI